MHALRRVIAALGLATIAAVASAQTDARATLVHAAFGTASKPQALALVNTALRSLDQRLAASPDNRDAMLQKGIGLGYRGQLTRGIGDAKAAKVILTQLATASPNDPDAQIALGGWHTSVIGTVGSFVGSTVLGASRSAGFAAMDRAVRLGGNRAFFPAYDGMMRIRLDKDDKVAMSLLERAVTGGTPAELDRITKASAVKVLQKLKSGDRAGAAALAERALPFGQVS